MRALSGSGGNDMAHSSKQLSDQLLTSSNAALASSAELGLPVRVVRKQAAQGQGRIGPTGREDEYVFDGLYMCTRYYMQVGISGYLECKFRLERLSGQPPINSGSVHFRGHGTHPLTPQKLPNLGIRTLAPQAYLTTLQPLEPLQVTQTL